MDATAGLLNLEQAVIRCGLGKHMLLVQSIKPETELVFCGSINRNIVSATCYLIKARRETTPYQRVSLHAAIRSRERYMNSQASYIAKL